MDKKAKLKKALAILAVIQLGCWLDYFANHTDSLAVSLVLFGGQLGVLLVLYFMVFGGQKNLPFWRHPY